MEPVAFTIKTQGLKFGICTDLGFASALVKMHLKECDLLYLESNHEESMVHSCSRPIVYKQRVLGRQGHLSNKACGELIEYLYHENLRRVYLAHLSGECNTPEQALATVRKIVSDKCIDLHIAYPDKPSAFFDFSLVRGAYESL